jgi:hypothetical protein
MRMEFASRRSPAASFQRDQPPYGPEAGGWKLEADACLFLDGLYLPAAIVAAVRADLMWKLGLMALRTLAAADGLQRIVRATLGGAGFRMTSFGIRHGLDSS